MFPRRLVKHQSASRRAAAKSTYWTRLLPFPPDFVLHGSAGNCGMLHTWVMSARDTVNQLISRLPVPKFTVTREFLLFLIQNIDSSCLLGTVQQLHEPCVTLHWCNYVLQGSGYSSDWGGEGSKGPAAVTGVKMPPVGWAGEVTTPTQETGSIYHFIPCAQLVMC